MAPVRTFAEEGNTSRLSRAKVDTYMSMKTKQQGMVDKEMMALKKAHGFEEKQASLIKLVSIHKERLTSLATHLTERNCGDSSASIAIINTMKASIDTALVSIKAATTMEGLQTAHATLRASIQTQHASLKTSLEANTKACILQRVEKILDHYSTEQSVKAQAKIDAMEAEELDTTEVKASFALYVSHMEAVKVKFNALASATITAEDIQYIKDELHSAKTAWEKMIKEMKQLLRDAKEDDEDENEGENDNEDDEDNE